MLKVRNNMFSLHRLNHCIANTSQLQCISSCVQFPSVDVRLDIDTKSVLNMLSCSIGVQTGPSAADVTGLFLNAPWHLYFPRAQNEYDASVVSLETVAKIHFHTTVSVPTVLAYIQLQSV